MLYAVLKPATVAVGRAWLGLRSRGREHVPATGPVLLAANHVSVLDPVLIAAVTPREVSFLAKAELFDVPLLGGLIRRLNARPLRREGADPAALRTALRILEEGRVLLVFPEGTRGEEGVLRPARPGAGLLAVLSGAPLVPVYIRGSGRAWPRGRRWPRPGRVDVMFGPPLRLGGGPAGDRKARYEAASREMMAAIARIKDAAGSTAPDAVPPQPERRDVGEVGVGGASSSPKYTYGRNGQHGEA